MENGKAVSLPRKNGKFHLSLSLEQNVKHHKKRRRCNFPSGIEKEGRIACACLKP
jgi:hypothetical protein